MLNLLGSPIFIYEKFIHFHCCVIALFIHLTNLSCKFNTCLAPGFVVDARNKPVNKTGTTSAFMQLKLSRGEKAEK